MCAAYQAFYLVHLIEWKNKNKHLLFACKIISTISIPLLLLYCIFNNWEITLVFFSHHWRTKSSVGSIGSVSCSNYMLYYTFRVFSYSISITRELFFLLLPRSSFIHHHHHHRRRRRHHHQLGIFMRISLYIF